MFPIIRCAHRHVSEPKCHFSKSAKRPCKGFSFGSDLDLGLGLSFPNPAAAENAAAIRGIEYTSLTRADAVFGTGQFNLSRYG